MQNLSCPGCGAATPFRAAAVPYAVCPFCRSLLVRRGDRADDLGKVAALQDEMTPLQIGASGIYQKQAFRVVGRLQRGWGQGFWSEWYVAIAGAGAWLAEAQGSYYFMREAALDGQAPDLGKLLAGARLDLNRHRFEVVDIKRSKILSCEGELPDQPPLGQETLSIDLSADDADLFGTLEQTAGESIKLYLGEALGFEDLALTGLRKIDGW